MLPGLFVQVSLALVHLAPLELHRDVIDAEQAHRVVNVLEYVLMALRFANDGVRAHRDEARCDGPHMQVMHRLDARDRLELRANGSERDVRRCGFEEYIDGLADDPPGTAEDQRRHDDRRDRISLEPAG